MNGASERAAAVPPPLLRLALCVVFAFIVIKAASSDLTWDEAWSYLFYGRTPLGFTILDYANDHPINSILIWASTRLFGDSEFIIRIPNVLAGGLYLLACARLVAVVRLKLLAFALCVLQPYLMDYFALARGYGIAAALVQFGLVSHFFDTKPRPRLMLACVLLASLTVFSTVVALYALLGSLVVVGVRTALTQPSSKGRGLRLLRLPLGEVGGGGAGTVLAFALLGLLPVAGLLRVSREGLPLYGSTTGFFDAILRGVARMYVANAWATTAAVVLLLSVAALLLGGLRAFGQRATTLLLASAISLGATWLSARVLGKPLPTGRLLLPFMPLWTLTLIAAAEDVAGAAAPATRNRCVQGASIVLCLVLGAIFLGKLHFQRYSDWPEDYRLQNRLAQALAAGAGCLPTDVWNRYGHVYYLERWFPPDRRPADVQCPPR